MALSLKNEKKDNTALISVSGEVDVSNAQELSDILDEALAEKPTVIDVDLSQVPYIDSTGIGILVKSAHIAADQDCAFTVSSPQTNVLRVLTLLGVGSEFNLND